MKDLSSQQALACERRRLVDHWLRFEPDLARRYDAETGNERCVHLRQTAYIGLALFNVRNLTNALLISDIVWLAVAFRLLIVTPAVLVIVQFFESMSATLRERVILFVVAGAFTVEIVLFWMTEAPLGPYTFNEFGLTLVYGNMLIALRYRHAVLLTVLSFVLAAVVISWKPGLEEALRFAFIVQIAMACIISLYANRETERRRCDDFIVSHLALLRAEEADQARRQFRDQSRTDALTNLPNRRLLDEFMTAWFSDDRPLAVMMVDIDHFKLFNDTMGHPAGDDCLQQIGDCLAAIQADNVLCARFGGEEFTVVLRDADEVGAARVANGLVRSIEALGIVHPSRSDAHGVVTASVGVAFRPTDRSATPKDVIAAADNALYRAKRMGRNRYMLEPYLSGMVVPQRTAV